MTFSLPPTQLQSMGEIAKTVCLPAAVAVAVVVVAVGLHLLTSVDTVSVLLWTDVPSFNDQVGHSLFNSATTARCSSWCSFSNRSQARALAPMLLSTNQRQLPQPLNASDSQVYSSIMTAAANPALKDKVVAG